jgi:hypothetical protein
VPSAFPIYGTFYLGMQGGRGDRKNKEVRREKKAGCQSDDAEPLYFEMCTVGSREENPGLTFSL